MAAAPQQLPLPACDRSQFLIVAHGRLATDSATKIRQAIDSWAMPNVQMHIARRLSYEDVALMQTIDYVFFLATCDQQQCRPQITPICLELEPKFPDAASAIDPTAENKWLAQKTVLNDTASEVTPIQLLQRAQTVYGQHAQAWVLSIPEALDRADGAENPQVAKALDAIAVFLRCYASPV
ncbi:MAG: hypothetical protein AAFQ61_08315 [Cyanobacteria bacterium J06626_23]